jgi:hypothetical protein
MRAKVFGPMEDLPPEAKAWSASGSVEYLGQTTFNDVRSAVYRVVMDTGLLRLPNQLTMRAAAESVSYVNVSIGLELYTQMAVRVQLGGTRGQSRSVLMTCQKTLDRAASKGI